MHLPHLTHFETSITALFEIILIASASHTLKQKEHPLHCLESTVKIASSIGEQPKVPNRETTTVNNRITLIYFTLTISPFL